MPKTPIDYSKTIIYKLCCNDIAVTEIYVGSTTNWTRRKQEHKCACNCDTHKDYNQKKYKFIRENGGWNNWKMLQIEAYSCQNKREAEAQERYWFELLDAQLNSICPFITAEERKEYDKQYALEYNKQYSLEHKQKKSDYMRQHYLKKKAEKNNL